MENEDLQPQPAVSPGTPGGEAEEVVDAEVVDDERA
jgi:hypothetical protein